MANMFTIKSSCFFVLLTFGSMFASSDDINAQFTATCGNWNDPCPEGLALVRCKRDPCSYSNACPDNSVCLSNFCGGCNAVCCPRNAMDPTDLVRRCFESDEMTCSDGTTLKRDPLDRCEFPTCSITDKEEEETTSCTNDMRGCPDGYTIVSRDPFNKCRFFPCPSEVKEDKDNLEENYVLCACDVRLCPDKVTYVSRDPENDCKFEFCPGGQELVQCNAETKQCSDGTFVQRDPSRNCEFYACPDVNAFVCDTDELICDDLTSVQRNKDKCCIFNPCPEETFAQKLERALQEMACEASNSGTQTQTVPAVPSK